MYFMIKLEGTACC